MNSTLKNKLKLKQIEFTIQTPEYLEALAELVVDINDATKAAENEASVEAAFEISVFSFILSTSD